MTAATRFLRLDAVDETAGWPTECQPAVTGEALNG